MNEQRQGWIYGLRLKEEPGRYRYVGQTMSRRGVDYRVYHHLWSSVNRFYGLPSQRWIVKHGEENITFDILEETTEKELDDREVFWIKTLRGEGLADLNIQDGGAGFSEGVFAGSNNPRSRLTEQDVAEIRKAATERYLTALEVSEKYGITPAAVSKILLNNTWYDSGYDPDKRITAKQFNLSAEEGLAFNREVTSSEVESMRVEYLKGSTAVEVSRKFQKSQTTTHRALFKKYGDSGTLELCLKEREARGRRRSEERAKAVEEYKRGGKSQKEVAEKYGVTQTALSQWVRRDRL